MNDVADPFSRSILDGGIGSRSMERGGSRCVHRFLGQVFFALVLYRMMGYYPYIYNVESPTSLILVPGQLFVA